jgi:peptidoglycan/LPS O-acetylase OafA/YrhL
MRRAPGLDLLRAVAILWVMYSHTQLFDLVSQDNPVATPGWMGVDLFFALSGFLIGGQLFRPVADGQPLGLQRFYLRRLLRTAPAYLVVVALYALFPWFRERQGLAPLWEFLTFTWNLRVDFLREKAFSHVWSLCVEEQFYLVAPLVVWLLARRPAAWKAVAACLGLLAFGMALRGYIWLHDIAPLQAAHRGSAIVFMERIYYPTWTRLDGLLGGVVLALVQAHWPATWAAMARRANLFLAAGVVGVGVAVWLFRDQRAFLPTVIGYPLLSASTAALVVAGASPMGLIGKRAVPGASLVAAMAYSLYLTHKEVFHLVQVATGGVVDSRPTLAFVVYAAAAALAGAALYLGVERPFLRLRDRIGRRPEPALPVPEKLAA